MEIRFKHAAILVVALVGIGFANDIFIRRKSVEEIIVEDDEPVYKRVKRSISSVVNDTFHSNSAVEPYRPGVTSSAVDRPFNQNAYTPEPADNDGASVGAAGDNHSVPVSSDSGPSYGSGSYNGQGSSSASSGPSTKSSSTSSSSTGSSSTFGASAGSLVFGNVAPPTTTPTTNGNSTSEPTTYAPDSLNCSPSVGGGAFGQPIQVTLTCSTASTIKFCVQENTCCDPEVEGIPYTGPIVLGGQNGNFCLSYFGKSTRSKISAVANQSYTFNNTFPDLQVNFPKINYQTTQLAGYNFLTSSDFSKSNFRIGEINLKNHDPSPSGLQLDCPEIVENYSSLTASVPEEIFVPLDQAGLTPGNQLNVPLTLSKLIYGNNFITSYAVDLNFPAPLYSCSTNQVTLNDFEYFAPEPSHGDAGTNTVREFSGSFVSYSFFEPEADLNRLPAGSANEAEAGQELRVGSFGIFY